MNDPSLARHGAGVCETPKSPPGDYNPYSDAKTLYRFVTFRVKHLNPRQGITTRWRGTTLRLLLRKQV